MNSTWVVDLDGMLKIMVDDLDKMSQKVKKKVDEMNEEAMNDYINMLEKELESLKQRKQYIVNCMMPHMCALTDNHNKLVEVTAKLGNVKQGVEDGTDE